MNIKTPTPSYHDIVKCSSECLSYLMWGQCLHVIRSVSGLHELLVANPLKIKSLIFHIKVTCSKLGSKIMTDIGNGSVCSPI